MKHSKKLSKEFGEVFTPISLVNDMLDTLPEEVWSNYNYKWLDPCAGRNAIFPIEVYKRLIVSLSSQEPDKLKLEKHIWGNMIHMVEIQEEAIPILKEEISKVTSVNILNVYNGSFLDTKFDNHMKTVWGLDKFDVIVMNPPYQEMDGGNAASAKPLYHTFILKSKELSQFVLSVHPSRWMAGGKGLDKFRKYMFSLDCIKTIKHFDDSQAVFGKSIDIRGGIQYLLIDNNYKGKTNYNGVDCDLDTYDVFIDPVYHSILSKAKTKFSLKDICRSRSIYSINTNDFRLTDTKINNDDLLCYVSKQKGFTKYVPLNCIIKNQQTISEYKVITARAAGKGGDGFGNTFIGKPNEVCTDSYISFKINNESEGNNLIQYMSTKFCNFLLSLRKNTQDIKPDTCKWIPLVDLSKQWTDDMLYKEFNLTKEEINLIETTIK